MGLFGGGDAFLSYANKYIRVRYNDGFLYNRTNWYEIVLAKRMREIYTRLCLFTPKIKIKNAETDSLYRFNNNNKNINII